MQALRRLVPGRRDDTGASAVEFALVAPILLVLVFGIIEYGFWFSDSLSLRQGVREAARQGVVANFGSGGCGLTGASGSGSAQNLLCTAKDRIGGISGDARVMVKAPEGWVRGKPLVVCAQLRSSIATGLVPLPNNRIIQAKVEMSIEKVSPPVTFSTAAEAPPSGGTWSWC